MMGNECEQWNRRYATEDWFFGRSPNQFLVEQIQQLCPPPKARILSLGELPCTHILFQDSFALKPIDLVMLKVPSYR